MLRKRAQERLEAHLGSFPINEGLNNELDEGDKAEVKNNPQVNKEETEEDGPKVGFEVRSICICFPITALARHQRQRGKIALLNWTNES